MSSPRVLYISYNSVSDPVAQSQVIPYIERLAEYGVNISLLTYEKRPDKGTTEFNKEMKERLGRLSITWYRLRYHKRPNLPATIYDILQGIIFTYFLLLRHRFNVIHARQIVPATICMVLRKVVRFKWVFDMRGLFAEESVAHGWKEGGLKYRSVKFMEKKSLISADFITVLTRRQKDFISGWPFLSGNNKTIEVIPCCVDLKKFSVTGRNREFVDKLGLGRRFTLVYLGSLGTCYLLEEMIDFFLHLRKKINNAFFLFVTHSEEGLIADAAKKRGLGKDDFKVIRSDFDNVPAVLSICDAGIYFINPYMKFGSFPIKLGEYLACGLPVVINSGIGDSEEIVKGHGIGAVVEELSRDGYERACRELSELFGERDALKNRCRSAAERYLSLKDGSRRYKDIYAELSAAS